MNEPIMSLAARYYTDPHVYRLETEGLLTRTWQFGCHASELAKIGDYAVENLLWLKMKSQQTLKQMVDMPRK